MPISRVASAPRFAADLPPGPFHARLAAVAGVRALLPVVHLTATRTSGVKRNSAAKIVANVTIYEHLRSNDHDVARWAVEVDELAGYPKAAAGARDALARAGMSAIEGDTLTMAAAAGGDHPAGRSGSSSVSLDPMMPAVVGFRAVLADLTDTIVANWPGTVERVDPEFLHDLRVAVRRTRTVIRDGKRVLPPAIVEPARERFGWLGTVTGPARDLDVHLINWAADVDHLTSDVVAALEPVHTLLEQRCDFAHDTLTRALGSPEATELTTAAATWWRAPEADERSGVNSERPLGRLVAKRIARARRDPDRTRPADQT